MKNKYYKWIILVLSVLVVLGALGFGRFGFTLVIPGMKTGLALSGSMVGVLVTVSLIGYLAGAVASGILASIFGLKLIISVSLFLLGISLFLLGISRSYSVALACALSTGLGSGGANVAVMALPAFWFPPERRGMATGIITSGSSFGILTAGFAVPAILLQGGTKGWRYSWVFMAATVIAVAIACVLFLKNRPAGEQDPHRQHSNAEDHGTFKPGFSRVYKSGKIWHLAGIYFTFGFSYIVYTTFFGDYLINEAGMSVSLTGQIWSGVGAVSMVSGLIWGLVSDKIGRKFGLAIVFSIQAVSYFLFPYSGVGAVVYISAFLFAITAWSIPAIMAAAAGDLLGKKLASAAFGFITLIFGAGQALGPFAAGRIYGITKTLAPVFFATSGSALLGAAFSLLLRPKQGQKLD